MGVYTLQSRSIMSLPKRYTLRERSISKRVTPMSRYEYKAPAHRRFGCLCVCNMRHFWMFDEPTDMEHSVKRNPKVKKFKNIAHLTIHTRPKRRYKDEDCPQF